MNGLIKGFGSLKKEMVKWNIYQLMIWLDRCVERIYTEIFLSIKTILNDAIKQVIFGLSGLRMYGKKIVHML